MRKKWIMRAAAVSVAAMLCFTQAAVVMAEEAQSTQSVQAVQSEQTADDSAAPSSEIASAVSEGQSAVSEEQPAISEEQPAVASSEASSLPEELALSEIDASSDGNEEEILINNASGASYRQVDAFAQTTNLKGIQGVINKKKYNCQHTLINFLINRAFSDANATGSNEKYAYTYNGQTFYFNLAYIMPFITDLVFNANNQNISMSMVFLLQWEDGKEWLIDEQARSHVSTPYYAPATTGEGAQAIEAFFSLMAWILNENDASIDNWILGNEVNNPNSWNYCGTLNYTEVSQKYARTFLSMYNAVRKYTSVSRCSISLDHNWSWHDEGRQIPGRDMLNNFNSALEAMQPNVDWSISYHLYPSLMYNTDIWNYPQYTSPSNANSMFIDGMNLNVLTDYVRDTFGSQHRVMPTEQGFSFYNQNANLQASALAISYYAAKYNNMVDSFIINWTNEDGGIHNFGLSTLAEDVYEKIDNGNAADQAWVESVIQQTSGRTVQSMVPNYGIAPDMEKIGAFVTRLYSVCLDRTPDAGGLSDWSNKLATGSKSGAEVAYGFIFSNEFKGRNLCNTCYVEYLYKAFFGRSGDPTGKADWIDKLANGKSREEVFNGFVGSNEFRTLCAEYGIIVGTSNFTGNTRATGVCNICGKDPSVGIKAFVTRLYKVCLDRTPDAAGLTDWSNKLLTGEQTGTQVAYGFVFSKEFQGKNLSNDDYVEYLYQAFFGRASDAVGKADWTNRLQSGKSRTEVFSGFANSNEFKTLCQSYDIVAGTFAV